MNDGISEVQARIAEIKARFTPPSPSAAGADFAATMNKVLGATSGTSAVSAGGPSAPSLAAQGLDPTTDSGGAIGQKVVDAAKKYLGVPYLYGGTDPAKGLDCSALLQKAFGEQNIKLPRVAADQAGMGKPVASLSQAKPGDILAFGSPVDHIGIYAGDNKMIVAPRRGDVVKVQDVYKTPSAIRRVVPDSSSSPSAAGSTPAMAAASSSAFTPAGTSSIPSSLSSQYNSLFQSAGAKHGISPTILAAVAKQESGFNASARSGAGAQGLMQIMPGTAKGLGVNALDPVEAVDGAARMLSGLVRKFGSVELALAGYNAGPGAVTKHGGIPPYKETQNYVRNIMAMSRQGGRP